MRIVTDELTESRGKVNREGRPSQSDGASPLRNHSRSNRHWGVPAAARPPWPAAEPRNRPSVQNDGGKFRISAIDVELMPEVDSDDAANTARLDRCEHLCEAFCIVTQRVRQGIPVNVTIKDRMATLST